MLQMYCNGLIYLLELYHSKEVIIVEQVEKKSVFGKIKVLIIAGVLIYTIFTFINQQSLLSEQLCRRDELAAKQAELEREMDFRKNELNYIGTEEYIEQQARTRLGWLYPDEVKYVESSNVAPTESEDAQ